MAANRLPPLPTVKDILRMYNIKAQKRLSQNFILDPRLLDRLARAGGDVAGKHVVEVGPGPGGITRAFLGRGATRVAVIEKDARFLPSLHLLAEASGDRLTIHHGDVLSFNMARLFPDPLRREWDDKQTEVAVIGNLPFNVSTPLIIRWLSDMAGREGVFSYGRVPLVLTFQQEVVDRMVAPPGSPHRSRLSVMCQNWASVACRFTIPGAAFVPKPDVDVGVATFVPLTRPYIDLPFPMVERLVTTVFHGKKKQLKHSVEQLFPKPMARRCAGAMLAAAGLQWDTRARAIDLDMATLVPLAHSYQAIVQENPSLARYNHLVAKGLALGPATYQDGQEYLGELDLARLAPAPALL